jgi:hypothetical protein
MKAFVFKTCFITAFAFMSQSVSALTVQVNDHKGKPLQDVIVYAEPLVEQSFEKTLKKVVISQKNKSFAPYISVAQTGNPLLFRNQDDITHHIYSASSSQKFAFLIRPDQEVEQPALTKSNEIVMGCNVHDWMSGYLLVLDTPYFSKTNNKGQANLDIQTDGRYIIVAWHPQFKEKDSRVNQEIDIKQTQSLTLDLTKKMGEIPEQKSDDGFDFLSDY